MIRIVLRTFGDWAKRVIPLPCEVVVRDRVSIGFTPYVSTV